MSGMQWQGVIEAERPRLLALSYRMTGSKAVAQDGPMQTTTFAVTAEGCIGAIWTCRNPDKLSAAWDASK